MTRPTAALMVKITRHNARRDKIKIHAEQHFDFMIIEHINIIVRHKYVLMEYDDCYHLQTTLSRQFTVENLGDKNIII